MYFSVSMGTRKLSVFKIGCINLNKETIMSTVSTMGNVQNPEIQNNQFIINATRINNTTSPEEKRHDSMHYTVTCAFKEILQFGLDDNLRDDYGSIDSIKNPTAVHREIKASFEENPSRFIQRNSGFTIGCRSIDVPQTKELGLNKITLTGASIINGAQTQGILKVISKEYGKELDHTNVRLEIIVEKNPEELKEIAIARNTSTNVSVLSRMGADGKFNILQQNMIDVLGEEEGKIQIKETDIAIPTQTLLQVIKAMTPRSIEDEYSKSTLKPSAVTAYSSKAGVTSEFRKMTDDLEKYGEVLNYFHTFSGYAWNEFESWTNDKLWLPFIEKNPEIGKYNKERNEISMQWGIICPTLYGLKNFLVESSGNWTIRIPDSFDRKAYMKEIVDMFKDSDKGKGNLQTFAKDRGTYSDLLFYTMMKLQNK